MAAHVIRPLVKPTPEGSSSPREAAAIFIFITILLDVMAMGVTIPVLPRLITALGGGGAGHVAQIFGFFTAIFAVMQFMAQPIQGALSDRFGRRPIILASNFGLGVDYLVMALAPTLGWLFLGRVISGAAAGSMTAASAYVADVSDPDQRARGFGRIWGAASLGIVAGPLLGGALSSIDIRAPFWAAAVLSLLNGAYGVWVLPESLKTQNRSTLSFCQLNPVGSVVGLTRRYPSLAAMLLVVFLSGLTWQGVNPLFVVYTTYRYQWAPFDISVLLAVLGTANFLIQTRLITLLVKRAGERVVALAGLALSVVSLVIFGCAGNAAGFWCGVPFLCLANAGGPAWQALTSNLVSSSEQGRLAGASNSVFSIAGIVAPIGFTELFAWTTQDHRNGFWLGGAFFIGALTAGLGLAVAVWATRSRSPPTARSAHGDRSSASSLS